MCFYNNALYNWGFRPNFAFWPLESTTWPFAYCTRAHVLSVIVIDRERDDVISGLKNWSAFHWSAVQSVATLYIYNSDAIV